MALDSYEYKDHDQVKAELSEYFVPRTRSHELISRLTSEKQELERENQVLRKQMETASKQFEYREQMANYYYVEEINSLNEQMNAIVQKNIVGI